MKTQYVLQQKTQLKYNFCRMGAGFKEIISKPYAKIITITYFLIVIFAGIYIFGRNIQNMDVFYIFYMRLLRLLYLPIAIIAGAFVLMCLGTPVGATNTNENLWRVGLTNHAGEAPLLLRKYKETDREGVIMEFIPNGIPRIDWEDKKDKIETALDVPVSYTHLTLPTKA